MESGETPSQQSTAKVDILKVDFRKGSIETVKDEVAVEKKLELYINGKIYAVFSISPIQIRELIIGHLLTEGIIESLDEIESLNVFGGRVHVHLKKTRIDSLVKPRLILTACGGAENLQRPLGKLRRVEELLGLKLNSQVVFRAVKVLNSQASTFRRTGGTHASTLLDRDGRVLAFSEDVGRHNAVDKVVGRAFMDGVNLKETLLASTGRLTSEIVLKAAQVGIPVVTSISAPTDRGVKAAKETGLTLIGFVRGRRFNVYTYPERLVM